VPEAETTDSGLPQAALGATEIILRMQMPGVPTEVLERSVRIFAEEVMPAFA
jgi:hypothetical protein